MTFVYVLSSWDAKLVTKVSFNCWRRTHIKNRDRDFGKIHGREKIYHMTILWNSLFCVYQKMPTILRFYSNTDFDTFWRETFLLQKWRLRFALRSLRLFCLFGSFLHTVKTRWKWHRSGIKITGFKLFEKCATHQPCPWPKMIETPLGLYLDQLSRGADFAVIRVKSSSYKISVGEPKLFH